MRRAAWIWATLEALAAAVCSGPTAAFLAPFAVELGAGGGQLGLLLGLTTLLTNVLQLQGAQWTRRGRTDRRLYLSAFLARASWLAAGAVPAALVGAGRADVAFLAFLAAVAVSSVATTASGPVMAARAATASGAWRRGGAPPNRVTATWLGALLGAGGMIALLIWRPGVSGYAAGYAAAGAIGLLGLLPYTLLVRQAPRRDGLDLTPSRPRPDAAPGAPTPPPAAGTERPAAAASGLGTRFGVRVAALLAMQEAQLHPSPARAPARAPASTTWWSRVSRRLGAPQHPELGHLIISTVLLQGGAAMIGPATPIWLVHHLGAPSAFLGLVSFASSLTALAAQRLWGRWIDNFGPARVAGISGALAAAMPLGWLLVSHPLIAIPVSALGGLAWGGHSLATTSRLLQLAPPAERAAYLGTYAAAAGIAGAAGALVAGAITAALPPPWIPLVFLLSCLTRGLGWRLTVRPVRS